MAEVSTVVQQPPEFIEAAAKPFITQLQQVTGDLSQADLSKHKEEVSEENKPINNPYRNVKNKPYNPYVVREPLESHYFEPWIGGWTRLNGRFVINPDLYGHMRKIVEIHEKIHNLYNTGNEGFVERMTQHVFRNGYFNLSGNYI